jgi:protein TonB
MEIKKYPKVDLSRNSILFFQLGIIIMLFITWRALEWKSYDSSDYDRDFIEVSDHLEEIIPITEPINTPPPPPQIQTIAPDIILEIEDESKMEESVIESTETNQNQEILEIEEIIEVEEEEEIVEVPFSVIENVPIYPGCENRENNDSRKQCMALKVEEFVINKFNSNLANELGLSGRQRIYVKFKIDKFGDVVDVIARAPHPKLEEEAVKVITSLPHMIPGKQRGVPVGVVYSLPIIFRVEEL